jgi:3',5'-cyclic-nucleotide phosphodiesterase
LVVFDGLTFCEEIFKKFLVAVKIHYHENAYHNFCHAVDVLQATYFMLLGRSASLVSAEPFQCPFSSFSSLEKFATLIAAYGHDIGHPGCNNFFMNNARTSLSILYHGESVLEHYHVALLFELFTRYCFFEHLSQNALQRNRFVLCAVSNDFPRL